MDRRLEGSDREEDHRRGLAVTDECWQESVAWSGKLEENGTPQHPEGM